jgi:hypothetical protein
MSGPFFFKGGRTTDYMLNLKKKKKNKTNNASSILASDALPLVSTLTTSSGQKVGL